MKDKLNFGKRRYFQFTDAPDILKRQNVVWRKIKDPDRKFTLEEASMMGIAILDTIPRKLRKGTPPHKAKEYAEKVEQFQSKRYYYEQIADKKKG